MNDYDKAGRYLVKRDPPGFHRWVLDNSEFVFQAWIDARRIALPNQGDLTNDLVAVLQSGEKFGKAPTRKQQVALGTITNLDQLEHLADRVLLVDSWSNLLNGHAVS